MTKQEEIKQLKLEKDAVLLAHYYVPAQVQEIADYVGDSFYLSKVASKLTNKVLVFCGVSFMGERGKLLNPDKAVLMPDASADCPMAHMVTKEEIDDVRARYEDLAVVCVTSANAVQIVKKLPNQNILFIPDKNLGRYVAEQVPEKNVMLVKGYCPVHEEMKVKEIQELKQLHPLAEVLAHPECNASVLSIADYIGSTTGILKQAAASNAKEFIIATEIGVRYELEKQNPKKTFYFPKTEPVCMDMKKITLDGILHVLRTGENGAAVASNIAEPSKATLNRMLELAA